MQAIPNYCSVAPNGVRIFQRIGQPGCRMIADYTTNTAHNVYERAMNVVRDGIFREKSKETVFVITRGAVRGNFMEAAFDFYGWNEIYDNSGEFQLLYKFYQSQTCRQ